MEQQKGCVQPRDHHVLIVARVTDNGHVVNRIARQILELAVAFDQEFDWISRIVQLRIAARSASVNRVQIKEASTKVLCNDGLSGKAEARPLIKRHIVIDE